MASSRLRAALFAIGIAAFSAGSIAPASAAVTEDVSIESFLFLPPTVNVSVGDTVRWTNFDGVAHNVSGGPLASNNFATGTFSHQFTEPGTFSYICTLHSGMTGEVVVAAVPAAVVPEVPVPALLGVSAAAVAALAFALARRRRPTPNPVA
jgi:plastocyanin